MSEDRRQDAVDAAARALAVRDHTRASLAARLVQRGFADDDCAAAVDALVLSGYLDDGRFAQRRAETLADRGVGNALIDDDLRRQGVPAATAAAAIAELEPEATRAERVAAVRGRTARTARFLARKGFAAESLEALVADLDGRTVG